MHSLFQAVERLPRTILDLFQPGAQFSRYGREVSYRIGVKIVIIFRFQPHALQCIPGYLLGWSQLFFGGHDQTRFSICISTSKTAVAVNQSLYPHARSRISSLVSMSACASSGWSLNRYDSDRRE